MSQLNSLPPNQMCTVRMMVLPLHGDTLHAPMPINQCYLCRGTITHDQFYVYIVLEDQSQPSEVNHDHLREYIGYSPTSDLHTEVPISANRCIVPRHFDCSPPMDVTRRESALARTSLSDDIHLNIEAQGNTTIDDFKEIHHLDKLYICSSYYDTLSLTVIAITDDLPTPLDTSLPLSTSYVISMPFNLSRVLEVRPLAWKPDHAQGIFQYIQVLEMIWSDRITQRSITEKVRAWCRQAFRDTSIMVSVHMHRITGDQGDKWRVVLFSRMSEPVYQKKIARFFQQTFLSDGVAFPKCMTWAQAFGTTILPSPCLSEYHGEALLSVHTRIQEWIRRRDSGIQQVLNPIVSFTRLWSDEHLLSSSSIYQTSINQHNEYIPINQFTYTVNSQIAQHNTPVYTLHPKDLSISCWTPVHQDVFIPCLTCYTKEQMRFLGVSEHPLDSKVQIWPPIAQS